MPGPSARDGGPGTVGLAASGGREGSDMQVNARWQSVMAALVVATASVAACGDGDERSHEAFVDEANALCDELISTRVSLAEQHFPSQTSPPSVQQLQDFYADMAPLFADFVEDFAAIEPAADDQATFDELVGEGRTIAATMTEAATDPTIVQRLLATDEAEFRTADALVVELGLNPEC